MLNIQKKIRIDLATIKQPLVLFVLFGNTQKNLYN